MNTLFRQLPNAMTCGNLLCGCIGLVMTLRGHSEVAAWLILLAGALDFGDGFVARLAGVSGPFGKELDSLADVVTFGVLPATLIFQELWSLELGSWSYAAYLIAVLSAIRLANFNIDTRQSDQFIGLPVPANSLLIAAFPLMSAYQPQFAFLWQNPVTLFFLVGFSFMLVAELPLLAFKFKSFGWRDNQIKFIFLIVSAFLLLFLQFAGVPLVIFLYILISFFAKNKGVKQ
ncbi:CDP-diacylglycerol--serine O-phosphatidyltransferase [Larkinella arboricola]|nr:CDP-diacylglycerol--serine O-phosphatidyltransferase [Larkinella arboricola]